MAGEKSIASSKSGSKQSYMIQEKTGFEKFSAELKDSVFQVLYLILKDEDGSFLGFAIGTGADYLQMLAFSFDNKVNNVWGAQDFLNLVFRIFSFFQLQTYFSDAFTFTSYLISFYLLISVIILMIINIIYVSYAFSKKRVSAIWPVIVLRSASGIIFTVFFLPITELLISMLQCGANDQGLYVLTNYEEVECFQGPHIIHATIAIVVIVIFVVLGFIVALACFEVRMLADDISARQHSRGDVLFVINKIVLQLAFSFFSANAQWWLVLIITGGACILWYSYNIIEPYYKKETSIFFKVMTTYYLWTSLLLFISKLLEDTSFDGGLIAWVIGLPFIGAIMLSSSKSRSNNLVQTTSRFKTAQQLMDHLRFVLQLIDYYKTDKNARILLTGYVEKHKDSCDEEDCPLKRKMKKRASLGEGDEMTSGLIFVVERMYQTGLKKFKTSAKLRISYATFLLERMKKMKKAEQELIKAREFSPGFEDQFIIFRLLKMISDGMEGVDVVGLIAAENYKNLYQDNVKESANLHKEFWSELREDIPNLHKLNYLGSRVNNAMNNAKDYWQKVQKYRPDDPVILRTYGRFLIDIQNDVVEGYELIQKAKKLVTKKNYHFARRNSFEEGSDSLPYVEMVASGQDMGKIKQANLLFTVLVGINRDEIIEKKINLFMPEIYSQFHDTFLRRYVNREEDYDIGFLDKDNPLFVRTKIGYINPVILRVRRIKSEEATNEIIFGAWFKTETAKRTYVHFICAKDGTITDMSASATTILSISLQAKKARLNIDKIVPNALNDKGYKEGKEIIFKTTENSVLSFIAQVTQISLRDEKNREFFEVYSNLNPGKPLINDTVYGYYVRLEKLEKTGDMQYGTNGDSSKYSGEKKRKKETIAARSIDRDNSMKTDPSRASKADNLEENQRHDNDGQIIYGFNTDYVELEISELFQNDGGVKLDIDKLVNQEEEVERETINYGEGIGLKKLLQGRLIDIRLDSDETPKKIDDDDDEEGLFNRKDDDELDLMNKKRKDKLSALKRLVRDALETNQKNIAVNPLRLLTGFWLLSLFVISILEFSILSRLFGDYEKNIHVVKSFVEKLTEVDNINSYIIDFMIFDTYPALQTMYNNETNLEARKKGIKDSVNRIVKITKELEEDTYYSFIEPYIQEEVTIKVLGTNKTETLVLNETEAMFFVSSRAYNLMSTSEGRFSMSNLEVLNVLSNYYNSILPMLRQSTLELQQSLTDNLDSFEYEFTLLSSLNTLIALIVSVWGMYLLIEISQQKEDILFLFLEIPLSNVDGISRKRDKFMEFFDMAIRQLQNNQENNNNDNSTDSDMSLDERRNGPNVKESVFDESLKDGTLRSRDPNDDEADALKDRKKLIKKFKSNKFNKAKSWLFNVLLVSLVSVAYSISSSASILINKAEIAHYSKQFFTTNLLSDNILSTINTNRLMRLDSDFEILGEDSVAAGFTSLRGLNSLGNNLGDFFLYVINQNNVLETQVTKLFFGNACEFISGTQECENSLSHSLRLGIFNLKEQVFKILMQEYNNFTKTGTTTNEEFIQLLKINDEFKEYAFLILQQFNAIEETYLKDILSNATSLQEIFLIVYLFLITSMVIVLWLPYLSRLNAEVWRTTRMINMIPLDVVNNIPSIKRFLKYLTRNSTN